jgi:hypothetical protein
MQKFRPFAVALVMIWMAATEVAGQTTREVRVSGSAGVIPAPFGESGCYYTESDFGYGGQLGLTQPVSNSVGIQLNAALFHAPSTGCKTLLILGPRRTYGTDLRADPLITGDIRLKGSFSGDIFRFEAAAGAGLALPSTKTPYGVVAVGMGKGPIMVGFEVREYWIQHTWEMVTLEGPPYAVIGSGRKPIAGMMLTLGLRVR